MRRFVVTVEYKGERTTCLVEASDMDDAFTAELDDLPEDWPEVGPEIVDVEPHTED